MRCQHVTQMRLAPSFSCASGLRLCDVAHLQVEGLKKKVSVAAIRALAILGQNDEVWRAVGRPGHSGRGVRILAMDGGGMKVRGAHHAVLGHEYIHKEISLCIVRTLMD